MREIKFRIWADTENGTEMLYLDKGEFDNGIWFEAPIHVDKHHNAMQFIGCVDKNKKEVYEGDIVLFPNNSKVHIVDFYQSGFVLKSVDGQIVVYNMKPQYIEVVGNIYENPDLVVVASEADA